jgi:hypothetical protein
MITSQTELYQATSKVDSTTKLYLQLLGATGGKESRARLLYNMLMKTDNPYYFLMLVLRRRHWRPQVMVVLSAWKGKHIRRGLAFQRSMSS